MILQIEMIGPRVHFLTGEYGGFERWWRDASYLDLIESEGGGVPADRGPPPNVGTAGRK